MPDPRTSIITERLRNITSVIAVSGGKGGVGKSLSASVLALTMVEKGYRVGLFDLDFTSPSTHVILGAGRLRPKEENGIVPPEMCGLRYMSIVYYSGKHASPLRGADISNALIELLAVTQWDGLDFLILDMPPGISDATLDIIRYIRNVRFLLITTPSQLAFETVKKMTNLLQTLNTPIIGVIENMKTGNSAFIRTQTESMEIHFLGEVPFDAELESAIGHTDRLLRTKFSKRIGEIVEKEF